MSFIRIHDRGLAYTTIVQSMLGQEHLPEALANLIASLDCCMVSDIWYNECSSIFT
jgi:hypothetical protein